MQIKDINQSFDNNNNYTVKGTITAFREIPTKLDYSKILMLITLQDETGSIEAIMFPEYHADFRNIIELGAEVNISGKIHYQEDKKAHLMVETIGRLSPISYDYFTSDNSYTLIFDKPEQNLICHLCHNKMQLYHTDKYFSAQCYECGETRAFNGYNRYWKGVLRCSEIKEHSQEVKDKYLNYITGWFRDIYKPDDYGLPFNISVCQNIFASYPDKPRLFFQNDYEKKVSDNELTISLSKTPEILQKNYKLNVKPEDVDILKNWIIDNYDVLLNHWNNNSDSIDLAENLKHV